LIARRAPPAGLAGTVVHYPLDVTDLRALADAARDFIRRFGAPELVIANAGVNTGTHGDDLDDVEKLRRVLDVNVTGMAATLAAFAPAMREARRGTLVGVASVGGFRGLAGNGAYCASKSAVDGITKALGCEWGDSGITVNALGPTVFRSPLTQWMFEDSERSRDVRKGFLARVPKGRLGEPSDLAGPLLFLASKASDFYTGHVLYADGGYTAG